MAALFATAALLLLCSGEVMEAAGVAAGVFVRSVMPALFPMMALNGLSAALPGREPRWATILFCFLSGSPASAQRLQTLTERKELSAKSLPPMAAVTGVMSPLFFVGSLGKRLPEPGNGWLLLAAHWLGALAAGGLCLLWQRRGEPPEHRDAAPPSPPPVAPRPFSVALTESLRQAGLSLLSVCGAMMLFSILARLLGLGLERIAPRFAAACPAALPLLWSLLEIGGGAHGLLDVSPDVSPPLLCALCSFGGFSLLLQNLLFLGKEIRPERLLLLRTLHGAIAYGICRLLFRIF